MRAALVSLLVLTAFAQPAFAQSSPRGRTQDLASCAGAVAAVADFDVVTFPAGAEGEWAPVMARILEALNTQPGVEGMTGRYAASAARSYWLERPQAARERAANACRTRYGGS